jgi:hypothetical protein
MSVLLWVMMACDVAPVPSEPFSASVPSGEESATLRLVYIGSVHGEIEPCG